MDFKGKTFLILGVSKGLGYALAYFLVKGGATVLISSRNQDKLSEIEANLRKYGNVISVPGEVSSRESLEDIKRRVKSHVKSLDGLAVLIGGYEEDTVEDLKGLDSMINNHLKYPLLSISSFLEMLNKGSAILLVSALRGIDRASPTQLSYASAKAGLAKAVEILGAELLDRGIRVVGIAPSWIDGDFVPERDWRSLRKLGDEKAPPEDFALVAGWLMSSEAEWVNGVVIPVDGGTRLKWG
ncbi:SDR family NAD(P)-dependent oxidoreductase [Metallosphaera hakonensis]|uniref:Short chain dehydrogenase n=1 Tax=Metallosphaera hakonensis JCM 8857 = DSM 7519 TaxID=1293036 RepID=A0A2U9IRW2_9CREN|nr:SDR family NAD(P)-dependent oxidoreductase [Metallosphaera hakonensis]AWR98756.1 SDR family oxidoreductase [Metallosphaera hakonensis JCM 8857 = DSM 7519]